MMEDRLFFNQNDFIEEDLKISINFKRHFERSTGTIFYIDIEKTKINERTLGKDMHNPFRTKVFVTWCLKCKKRYFDFETKLYSGNSLGPLSGSADSTLVCPEGHVLAKNRIIS